MSTYNPGYVRPQGQGNYAGRGGGGGRRNNDSRQYRSHGPSVQIGQPPIMQHLPRGNPAVNVHTQQGRVLLSGIPQANQPLLLGPGLTGPNARAPTIFPQSYGLVPQAVTPQLITQTPPGSTLPGHQFFVPQQPPFATQQPINLGIPAAAQMGGTNAPQQMSAGLHAIPHMMATTVNTAGTTNQVPHGASVTTSSYRQRGQPQTKRSKAIKIIDPNTNQEVNVEGKPENPNPPPSFPDSAGAQVHVHAPPTVVSMSAPVAASAAANVAQDFKRRVYERTATGEGVQVTAPNHQKPPPPNAIITDPNKFTGVSSANKSEGEVGVDVPSSKQAVEIESLKVEQQQQHQHQPVLPPFSVPSVPPTASDVQQQSVSEQTQEIRDKFYQQVHQTVEAPAVATVEKAATQDDKEEETQVVLSSQAALETKEEVSAPQSVKAPQLLPQPLLQPVEQPTRQLEAEPAVKPVVKPVPIAVPQPVAVTQPSVVQPVAQPVSSQPISSAPSMPTAVSVAPPAESVESTTTETEVSKDEPTVTQNAKEEKEREDSQRLDDTSKSEVSEVTEQQAPATETPETPILVPLQPEKTSVEKQTKDAVSAIPVAMEPEVVDTASSEKEESSREADTDDEKSDSEPSEPQKGEEERASSESVEIAEEPPPEMVVGLYEEVSESETNGEEGEVMVESQSKDTQEVVAEPVSGTESAQVPEVLSVAKSLPLEQLSTEGEDTKRTEQPKNIESEVIDEVKPEAVKQQEPPLSSEINKTTEKDEVQLEPPKRDKQEEQPPPLSTSKVVNPAPPAQPIQPADKDRTSPPVPTSAKPKEVVKQVEPVRSEKKSKPPPSRPPDVPATARPVLPSEPSESSLGRTMYGRDFLLSFREFCRDVPPELAKFDVFSKEGSYVDNRGPIPNRDYYRESSSRDYGRDYSKKGPRRQNDSRRGGNYQPISKEPVDLHKAEKRWVRPSKTGGDLSEQDAETEELFRKFQGILNKLTPQKFQNLAEQALKLKIDSEDRLKGCIDKIFTKALEEPKFSIAYANLCKVMSTIKVELPLEEGGKQKFLTFRRVLLTKCQQEFEKDKKEDEEREKMVNAVKETEDAEKKKQLEEELIVLETKNRRRSLGNIRFIGELFKLKMLSETIMHECVVRLLRSSSDEESLECFAGLITTTGKDLDRPEAKTRIDSYFARISEIIKKDKVPARIKFMLQDVQDLRANKWVPRQRQEQSLKTIDQIHHEAKVEEEKEKEFVAQAMAGSMKHGGGGRDSRRGSLKPDDWQGGKGDRDRRDKDRDRDRDRDRDKPKEKLDARKLQVFLKREKTKDSGPPTLGPATFRPQGWGRGGSGVSGAAQDSTKSDKDKRPSRTSSGLTKRSDKDKLPISRGSGSSAKRAHSTPTPDSQAEKALLLQTVAQATKQTQPPQSHSQPAKAPPTSSGRAEQRPAQDKMDEATVRRKTGTIVDELVQNKDFKEAVDCVREMRSPGKMNFLVAEAINHSLEKSSQHRQLSGRLFSKLLEGHHITKPKFLEGLNEVLEFAEDIAIDIPKIWDYLGELLSPVVAHSTLPLSSLSSSLLTSGKASLLAAKILVQCRSQLTSDEEVASLWTASSLEWSTLGVSSEDLGEFLSRHSLAYLHGSSQPSSDSQPLKYVTELTQQFSAPDVTNDDIFEWIEAHCRPPVRSTPEFVATVTTAIVNATVSGSGSSAQFSEENFKRRTDCIKKYVVENKELQLRVLYALQIAVAKLQHPPGMLYRMFNVIYDVDIVGEDTFRKWKDEGTETFGKGAAVATVKNFFDWLDSCETESDDAS